MYLFETWRQHFSALSQEASGTLFGCPEFRAQFKAAYRDFVDGYREALQALNRGLLTPLFPQGGLPPGYSFEVG